MNSKLFTLSMIFGFFLLGCEQYPEPAVSTGKRINLQAIYSITQQDIDIIAKSLIVNYRVSKRISSSQCGNSHSDERCYSVNLSFTAIDEIAAKDWTIVFSHLTPIKSVISDDFTIKHLNDDLHEISLKGDFSGFAKGEKKQITFATSLNALTEVMPNFIISAPNLPARVIESTVAYIDKETGLEVLPHVDYSSTSVVGLEDIISPQRLYQQNKKLIKDRTALLHAIIPTPKSVTIDANYGFVDISHGINFSLGNVLRQEVDAALTRLSSLGIKHNINGLPLRMRIVQNENKPIGSYHLSITKKEITIIAVDGSGAFNGLQSLASLITVNEPRVALMSVDDEPDYQSRGVQIDVASNFHNKSFILKLLEQMAAYKLNTLTLHVGDDEGWRLEIPGLTELTEVGSKRCLDFREYICLLPLRGAGNNEHANVNGFYNINDYQEILRFAKARHIQIIPSFDMTKHSRAAIKSMTARYNKYLFKGKENRAKQFVLEEPKSIDNHSSINIESKTSERVIDACLSSSYAFIERMMTQLKEIHKRANHPLSKVNIGVQAKETSESISDKCADLLTEEERKSVKSNNAYYIDRVSAILAKLDIAMQPLNTASFAVESDNSKNTNTGRQLTVSFNESAGITEQIQGQSQDEVLFSGVQGQLWTDKLRTISMVEYKIFPRILVLADWAWQRSTLQRNDENYWNNYAHVLGEKSLAKLDIAGVDYRLPNVGAVIRSGKLYANVSLPTLPIEYQQNDGTWRSYKQPVEVYGSIKVRSRSHDGLRAGKITEIQ